MERGYGPFNPATAFTFTLFIDNNSMSYFSGPNTVSSQQLEINVSAPQVAANHQIIMESITVNQFYAPSSDHWVVVCASKLLKNCKVSSAPVYAVRWYRCLLFKSFHFTVYTWKYVVWPAAGPCDWLRACVEWNVLWLNCGGQCLGLIRHWSVVWFSDDYVLKGALLAHLRT